MGKSHSLIFVPLKYQNTVISAQGQWDRDAQASLGVPDQITC